jgi:DNA invertase Pin-like site-specific DNA recombinase
MTIGYVRVSTKGQLDGNSIEEQANRIREKYPVAEIVVESLSGAKERPIFSEAIKSLCDSQDKNNVLVVTKLDRFCRSTKEGLGYVDLLTQSGVDIHILNMGLIEDTPMGRMIVTNLLAFAEFERAMIAERCQAGKAIARQDPNFREGRPRRYSSKQIGHALELLEGKTYRQVEEMTGISKSTLIRAKRAREDIEKQKYLIRSTPII